jgi:hypothetical protein
MMKQDDLVFWIAVVWLFSICACAAWMLSFGGVFLQ